MRRALATDPRFTMSKSGTKLAKNIRRCVAQRCRRPIPRRLQKLHLARGALRALPNIREILRHRVSLRRPSVIHQFAKSRYSEPRAESPNGPHRPVLPRRLHRRDQTTRRQQSRAQVLHRLAKPRGIPRTRPDETNQVNVVAGIRWTDVCHRSFRQAQLPIRALQPESPARKLLPP